MTKQMYNLTNVYPNKCTPKQMSMWTNVYLDKGLAGKMSDRTVCSIVITLGNDDSNSYVICTKKSLTPLFIVLRKTNLYLQSQAKGFSESGILSA